jgi:GntR family transcriptional regulator
MNFTQLDPQSPIPLYSQIKKTIVDYIETNELKPNAPLPSERELAEMFQVSRLTVRKAIDNLIQEGIAFRLPGKGTYVNLPKLEQPLLVLTSFTEAIKQEGHTPGSKLLDFETKAAKKSICKQMGIEAGSEVTIVRRLRFVDNLPFSVAYSYLPTSIGNGLNAEDLQSQSLYSLIEKTSSRKLSKTSLFIESTPAEPDIALLLKIKPESPLFYLYGTVSDQFQNVVEYFEVYYRGDRLRFSAESKS